MSLSIANLSAHYARTQVLKQVNLTINQTGRLIVLLGPNAAGKSTLFKTIAGLIPTSDGQVQVLGQNMTALSRQNRLEKICYLPQGLHSSAALTVFESILFARKTNNHWRHDPEAYDDVAELIELLNIGHLAHRPLAQLSGGQKQLAAIAQALSRHSPLMLLDEPTSALDLNRELEVLELLKEQTQSRQIITIVALHNLTLAAQFADDLLVLKQGEIQAFGNTEEILHSGVIESTYGINIEVLKSSSGKHLVAIENSTQMT